MSKDFGLNASDVCFHVIHSGTTYRINAHCGFSHLHNHLVGPSFVSVLKTSGVGISIVLTGTMQ